MFVPLDLLFRLCVWISYRQMLGPLTPEAVVRLVLLDLLVVAPLLAGWIAGLVWLLAPIDRWLVQASSAGDEDGSAELLRRACRAAVRAPRRFSLVFTASWMLAFVLNLLVLGTQTHWFPAVAQTWVGASLMLGAIGAGSFCLALTFLSWYLGPTMGQLSLTAHARGLSLDERSWSLRARNMLVALCLGVGPVLWMSSITYTTSVRAQPGAVLIYCFTVVVWALLCAGFLGRSIGAPVASISRVIRDIADQGDVTHVKRIPVFQRDEIGDLVDGANRMLDRLEEAARRSRSAELSLRQANEDLEHRVLERTAELARSKERLEASLAELSNTQRELLQASRLGGMAEVASVVLHNVGNLLTSINVSAEIAAQLARESRVGKLGELAELLAAQGDDLARFLSHDERGRLVPSYLVALSRDCSDDGAALDSEIGRLKANLEQIMIVIAAQQSLARGGAVAVERVEPGSLLEEAMKLSLLGGARAVQIVREIEAVPSVSLDRHLVLQILTNLLRNAQEAVQGVTEARIELWVRRLAADRFCFEIADNGAGIESDNLARIFNHGFTTKRDGNGFGLHSSACSARMMGGSLTASSPGPGRGATFRLELPASPRAVRPTGEEQSPA